MRNFQDAWFAGVIRLNRIDAPVDLEYFFQGRLLAVAKFEHHATLLGHETGGFRRQSPIVIETIDATVESSTRVEQTDFRLERVDLGGWDVRRIADHQVKSKVARQRAEPIAQVKSDLLSGSIG